ncbi:4-hydroxythreonine-4-phosphate dehydrogenase PdxA [Halorhodospira abdelmalekii]|uniref:4-hydroxythreonine-4-phosphate dehydrogenase PdxA n=1 Tax=Halorhodospira abdelmalekii TaxID=421629 RepID=UPI0019077878|nr:4-hydroxythreonine-4-phosphate dehydrogenase PdxA [Halorhodospira abdelmalekii]MBK1734012.1 4-hydroxythreonine-4-phosphate dehydrogenase PdxA [Halorhodospira abdelmalekii]
MSEPLRIAVTCGEPAGIGYELVAEVAMNRQRAELIAIGDPELLRARQPGDHHSTPQQRERPSHDREDQGGDEELGRQRLRITAWDPAQPRRCPEAGRLAVDPVAFPHPVQAGRLEPGNAHAVTASLRRAVYLCLENTVDAVVTAPVHKGVINEAGIAFSGHTELIAELTGTPTPVMMLVAGGLRVALATTHLPLAEVPAALTPERLECVVTTLHHDLVDKFAIAAPRIVVTGLNPHAGENGHLGREEIEVITPILERLRQAGMNLTGPVPADTVFTPAALAGTDAVLTMYHDQGLPVLKHVGFGRAVNVTLGLPIVRTSVDHGTALALAGSGQAEAGSLQAAIDLAAELALRRQHRCPPPDTT